MRAICYMIKILIYSLISTRLWCHNKCCIHIELDALLRLFEMRAKVSTVKLKCELIGSLAVLKTVTTASQFFLFRCAEALQKSQKLSTNFVKKLWHVPSQFSKGFLYSPLPICVPFKVLDVPFWKAVITSQFKCPKTPTGGPFPRSTHKIHPLSNRFCCSHERFAYFCWPFNPPEHLN